MTDDLVATCPDCGTASVNATGENYWCTRCCAAFAKGDAVEREREQSATTRRGLAGELAAADPEEVSAE